MMEGRPMGPTVWCRAAITYRDVGTGPILLRFIAIRGQITPAILVPSKIFYILSALSGDKGKFTADES